MLIIKLIFRSNDLKRVRDEITMRFEKGEDLKQSTDQSSPCSRRYATEDYKRIIPGSMRLHFFQITGFIPGHLELFGKFRKQFAQGVAGVFGQLSGFIKNRGG